MKQNIPKLTIIFLLLLSIMIITLPNASAQVAGTERRYVRTGSLQTYFTSYGSERAWNNVYYEGLIWPADYFKQDNAVITRAWMAAKDFTDAAGQPWEVFGTGISLGYVDLSLYPMQLKQIAKFAPPVVLVDGSNVTAPYTGDVDEVDQTQVADRVVLDVVNTSLGLTMTRRMLFFTQQYHDNYYITEYTFENTGNVDYDDDIELNKPLKGVRVGWGIRYACGREGGEKIGDGQVWGKHTWVTKRGEDYPLHATEKITEANPIVQWIRCGFSWAGQTTVNSYDNIGAPLLVAPGRLTGPQFAGIAILHVDKSGTDKSDDPNQPAVLGWHAGDTYPSVGNLQQTDLPKMIQLYEMLSGIPYTGLGGTNRMDEVYMATNPDPVTVHNDGGGTNVWICYGPFDLEPGQSVRVVEVQAISGLSRPMCEVVGKNWLEQKSPYTLPDGSTTTNKDTYKNSWFYTGKDSIMETFGRAKRNFDLGYEIPQPPLPPALFNVESGGDRISLSWSLSESESDPGFAGYEVYRAVGKTDTVFDKIATVPPGTNSYNDTQASRGFSYYYYLCAVNDGSNNTTGEANPVGALRSGRFYTRTTEPAYLRRKAGVSLKDIRVVPNPYNIKARGLQYLGEPDKITFLDIPARCRIRIFTERGDLIQTIEHTNGSGDESWNSVTSSRQVVVSGIYIAHFEVIEDYKDPETNELLYKKGESAIRKFVIIR
ncbi:MAG: fibronectin [bacterium]|jgi:hypothetical protein|nr:fibronectin [bacterium]